MYTEILEGIQNTSDNTTASQVGSQAKQPTVQPVNSINPINPINQINTPPTTDIKLFDVQDFLDDLAVKSATKNEKAKLYSTNINSYDVAHNCIREVVFKILNYPVESYRDVWLPIMLRAYLGNAVHDFIQTAYSHFTETEVSVKVPSIRASTRMDCLINNNVLVEIKSCTYDDYYKIIKNQRPRDPDFYQTIYYKYLLENHLEEAQKQQGTRSAVPAHSSYNIEYIQVIYVAHDLASAECKSMAECVKVAKEVKQMLNSKINHFQFITAITLDLKLIDPKPYEQWIVGKVNDINRFLDNKTIPPMSNPYINSAGCHFCMYKKVCSQYKG